MVVTIALFFGDIAMYEIAILPEGKAVLNYAHQMFTRPSFRAKDEVR